MKTSHLFVASAVLFAAAGFALAAGIKSGPQKGEELAGPFHPLNVNGEKAGKKHCLYCENGDRPVAMIFARQVTPELTKLIKEIDSATVKNDGKMGSFVVFLGDSEGLEAQLKKVVEDNKIKKTVLAIDNPAGPEGYKVARDADVTVVLYKEHVVEANFAFKKGEMKDDDVATVVK